MKAFFVSKQTVLTHSDFNIISTVEPLEYGHQEDNAKVSVLSGPSYKKFGHILLIQRLRHKADTFMASKRFNCTVTVTSLSHGNLTVIYQSYSQTKIKFIVLAPVVQRVNNAIHWINHYPMDSVVCFANTNPLDSDLSSG